ncbi:MAG TPA: arginine--tRNA ligase [Pseudomonadales bacterium]|nr:arginine--tRNA ligase [Pseudomonadales bacterium]
MNLRDHLNAAVEAAMRAVGIPADCQALLTQSTRPEFGDYQANGAMGAAKRLGTKPRELAERIVAAFDGAGMVERLEIAGPGFINIHLAPAFLAARVEAAATDARLGIPASEQPQTVVVDYSAPNLAKEMHVGHLRSTIIGDAVVRALEFRGERVIRQNHVGDWGTQFGMLIAHLEDVMATGQSIDDAALADLEGFYRSAKQCFDADPAFADRARDYVVRLQSGDAHCRRLWQRFIDISVAHSEEIYRKLNVTLTHADIKAESAYNDDLPVVIAELDQRGLLAESEGARVVFLEEMRDRDGNAMAVIVQKGDGGFLYATTDLAAARYRAQVLHADRILYFIDDRQKLHMQQVFAISRRAGFVGESTTLEHHPFGKMLGEDGKPFKTRSGGTVKLAELLDEAVERAARLLAEREADLSAQERAVVARQVGIGAVKYADLSKNRTSDYVFSWEHMLSFEGNTAPYLQYACTRVRSIFRKAGIDTAALTGPIGIDAPEERALALRLAQFSEALSSVTHDAAPHLLCAYLYDLAGLFMRFYENCPILRDDVPPAVRASRLRLADVVARTLATGLELLGIETPTRM